ncbi:nickel/cobalt transporter [Bradyrhizobium sp. AUGA SZCCT0158]|uniref:nickel/cobalt transporter n=1 Tax=Bradyrhizobium sp. AUGA SZCCT0158 TaxID=2807661 RepID=UPI001BA664E2|nr:nickel/cobalt transporter [Bradyrhizobium sp. AUGA SZCCT0158]MBR1199692.1 nickel/cobalt transporter [Bradyrhizobium sp. AUGA SZCCT0158]
MIGIVALAAIVAVDGVLHALLAQNPFGGPRPAKAPEPQVGGIVGWLLAKQSEFYREMSATIRAAKSDGSAVWTLLAISFAYGIFHAAGPGHGKAVISSYLVANQETARRGIVLSFASAMLQALVAVLIVGICAWLLNATAKTMCGAEKAIEIASYALIAAFGARLVWTKGGGFMRALQAKPVPAMATATATASHHHNHGHDHHHHHHEHHHHAHAHADAHSHAADHVHDEHCGHSHGPTPDQLAGPGGWQRGLGAIFAVGLRPCSGAILVLVFALAQGLFWAGIAATFVMGLGTAITVATIAIVAVSARGLAERLSAGREGGGALIMRGIEFGAAGLVLLFGLGLLFGYLAAERVTCL